MLRLAVLAREWFLRSRATRPGLWTEFFVFLACMAFTGTFELIEFAAAVSFGDASDAYLGSQGDPWDAQWDMTMCLLGTLLSILVLRRTHLLQLEAQGVETG